MRTLAELRGWSPFVGLQLPYSLAERDPERESLPMAAAFGLAVTPWGVIGQGALTGKPQHERRWGDPISERVEGIVDVMREVADAHDATPPQIAIAWMRARPAPPTIVPIVGARTAVQMRENLAALDVDLTPDELERLDDVSKIPLGFPRSFLESENVRNLIYGETWSRLRMPAPV